MPALSHAANVDLIGLARISNTQLPNPPPPFYQPAEYITSPYIDKPSRHAERVVDVALSGGGTTTMPLGQGLVAVEPRETLSFVSISKFEMPLNQLSITLDIYDNNVFTG
jgi:hypothetical protein